MTPHAELERLVVAAIDFSLTPAERAEVERHVPGCDPCRAIVGRYRADAVALRKIAVVPSPPRVRAAVLQAAARRRISRPSWQLLAAAALLAAMLAGAVLGVGAFLRQQAESRGPISWTAGPSQPALSDVGGSIRLTGVAGGPGGLVAIGGGGGSTVVLRSTNGAEWTAGTVAPDGAVESIAYLDGGARPGEFVAAGERDGRPAVWWSADGIAWQADAIDASAGVVHAVAAVGEATIAVGSLTVDAGTESPEEVDVAAIWRLAWTDGAWERLLTATGEPGAADAAGPLIAVGPATTGLVAIAATGGAFASTDGATWRHLAEVEVGPQPQAVAAGLGRLVAVAHQGDGPVVRASLDGLTWTDATAFPNSAGARIGDVTFRHGRFLAVGGGARGALAWTSADGLTWIEAGAIPDASGAQMLGVAWLGDRIVVVGGRGTAGATWTGEEAGQ